MTSLSRQRRMLEASQPVIPTACEVCGEPFDEAGCPNIEAFEVTDQFVCDECADGVLEDNGQFGVGA